MEPFAELYRQHIDEIYRFIYYKTSNKEVAEDLTAQTFMQALEHLSQFQQRPGARFSSWLYTIARNQVIDHYRRHKQTVDLDSVDPVSNAPTAGSLVDEHLQKDQVKTVLQMLPESDRELLQLRLWQDQSYSDIAKIIGVNQIAVRARYSRALKKFKQLFVELYSETYE